MKKIKVIDLERYKDNFEFSFEEGDIISVNSKPLNNNNHISFKGSFENKKNEANNNIIKNEKYIFPNSKDNLNQLNKAQMDKFLKFPPQISNNSKNKFGRTSSTKNNDIFKK